MKSECDRVTEAAESGDVRAVEAYLDRGGNIEAKDTRIGAVSHPYTIYSLGISMAMFCITWGTVCKRYGVRRYDVI